MYIIVPRNLDFKVFFQNTPINSLVKLALDIDPMTFKHHIYLHYKYRALVPSEFIHEQVQVFYYLSVSANINILSNLEISN